MTDALSRRSLQNVALFLVVFTTAWVQPWALLAQAPRRATDLKYSNISPDDLREWLTYLSSDQLQGRQVFTEGYGLAAQYIASRLEQWGVKPLGPNGTYLQPVSLKGYRVIRNSSVTLDVNGESKTFKHGDHVTFPANAGGMQSLTFSGIEFVGYGQPGDLQGRDLKGKLLLTVPNLTPPAAQGGAGAGGGRGGRGGNAGAIAAGAAAVIAFAPAPAAPTAAEQALAQAQAALTQANAAVAQAQQALRGGRGDRGGGPGAGRGAQPAADVTTVQRIDDIVTPQFTGDDTFFEALFAGSPVTFADIKAKAQKGEPIAPLSLPLKLTVSIDNTYEAISQQVTHNVVGMVEGTDRRLKETYVLFGSHLDHVGYSQTTGGRGSATDACRRRTPTAQASVTAAGKVVQRAGGARGGPSGGAGPPANAGRGTAPAAPALPFDQRDFISNGADDDGSGSAALLAIAKAFAQGPKPKRSLVFVWHAGEESGLLGSRYNADFPVIRLDRVQAQLNMDMVGRNDCDNIEGDYSNTLFVVGADRISTDLHNLIVQTNTSLKSPLTLDYELNDPNDPENVYTRSDHFSYAAKGIPIAFFTTGLHPDYHRVSDTVDKIVFPKMARIAELVYQTGFAIANTERPLEHDNKGPRTGFGSKAEIIK